MYTLLELESKTFGELKKIGSELNVLPEGDRRRRETWIDAIAGVNPPLLQLLEVSPAASVEQVAEPISQVAKTSPGVEGEQAQERIEEGFNIEDLWKLDEPNCPACGGIYSLDARWSQEYAHGFWIIYCQKCDFTCSCSIELLPPCLWDDDEGEDEDDDSENSSGVEVYLVEDQQLPECVEYFDDGFVEDESGVIKLCQCGSEPKSSRESVQSAIAPAAKNLPSSRSKTSTAHQLLELFKSSAHIIEDSPGVKTEATVSGSAIEPAAVTSQIEPDQNPILTGIVLSDRFLARYSPPQPENIHFRVEADGQLSLIDFEVQSQDEPPDPDDFDSLDAFREAIALWDAQNPEPLAVSLDSMCEWAPCPEAWYEPEPESLPLKASSMIELPEQSEVMELSPGCKSSITSEFFIPTFGRWGDRSDMNDEPPDTGIFARLPKPKPPKFPPQASQPKSAHVRRAPQDYPETIPKQFSRVAAGSTTQPARSPPGGDA